MNVVSAVTDDGQSMNFYDRNGNIATRIFVTTGHIIGQPTIGGDMVTVVYEEGQWRYMAQYDEQANIIRRTVIS